MGGEGKKRLGCGNSRFQNIGRLQKMSSTTHDLSKKKKNKDEIRVYLLFKEEISREIHIHMLQTLGLEDFYS